MGDIKAVDMETALTDYFRAEDALNAARKIAADFRDLKALSVEVEKARRIARQSARVRNKQNLPRDWRPGEKDREWLDIQITERETRIRGGNNAR